MLKIGWNDLWFHRKILLCCFNILPGKEIKHLRLGDNVDNIDLASKELGKQRTFPTERMEYLVTAEEFTITHWYSMRLKPVKIAYEILGLT